MGVPWRQRKLLGVMPQCFRKMRLKELWFWKPQAAAIWLTVFSVESSWFWAVVMRTDKKNLVVWAVSAEGIFVGNAPVRYEAGWAVITLGKKSPSVYYLFQSE